MKIIKSIISVSVLLTYSLGFAHTLVPHCQELISGEYQTSHHHHKHHQHQPGEEKNPNHEHILHENYFDAGVYDLILCILSETEHPSNECNVDHYIPVNGNDNLKELTKAKLLAVLFTLFQFPEQSDTLSDYIGEDVAIYQSPPLDNSPSRGPPYFSC
jgi:hypothetical protein